MRARKTDRVPAEARRLIPLSVLLSVAVFACGSSDDRTSGFEARDSSGIRITVNSDYQWPEGERWRLSDQPQLDIGRLEGEDHYQFFRIINAVTLGDGRIVVANSGVSSAAGVHITDTLPMYVVGAGLDTTATNTAGDRVSYTLNVTMVADVPLGVTITNTAYYSHTSGRDQSSAAFSVPWWLTYLPIVLK